MNKKLTLLAVLIALAVFAVTWQHIPIVNTYIWNSGIVEVYAEQTTKITDAVRDNPTSLLGVVGGLSTLIVGTVKKWWDTVKSKGVMENQMLTGFQQEKGNMQATWDKVKAQLTGAKDQLQGEYDTLLTQKTDLEATLTMKDKAIIDVQSELGKAQAQVIATQAELRDTLKELAEVRIANEQKTIPTSH